MTRTRPMIWIAVAINLGFAFAMVQALRAGSARGWCNENPFTSVKECGPREVGAMVGPGWLAFAWGVTAVVLGVMLWHTRRPKGWYRA